MSINVRSRGGQTQTQRKPKCEGCKCLRDPETGLCCATGRCGCKKNKAESGGYCGEDCWCMKPLCECLGDKNAVKRTVMKEGSNTGRTFFCCRLPQGKQCGYFQWAELPLHSGKRLGKVNAPSSSSSSPSSSSSSAKVKNAPKVISLLDSSDEDDAAPPSKADSGKNDKYSDPEIEVLDVKPSPHSQPKDDSEEDMERQKRDQNIFVSPCANQFNTRGAVPVKPMAKPKPKKAGGGRDGLGGGKKERCAEGRNCKFRHEYQHGLEFYHSDEEEARGGGRGAPENKKPKGFVPFGGTGMKLGVGGGGGGA